MTTVQPGMNLPSLFFDGANVGGMFVHHITAHADGSLTSAMDPEVLGDRHTVTTQGGHFGLVPSFTMRDASVGHLAVPTGHGVKVYATADNEVTVELYPNTGELADPDFPPVATVVYTDQPVVVRHADISADAIKAYYAE